MMSLAVLSVPLKTGLTRPKDKSSGYSGQGTGLSFSFFATQGQGSLKSLPLTTSGTWTSDRLKSGSSPLSATAKTLSTALFLYLPLSLEKQEESWQMPRNSEAGSLKLQGCHFSGTFRALQHKQAFPKTSVIPTP